MSTGWMIVTDVMGSLLQARLRQNASRKGPTFEARLKGLVTEGVVQDRWPSLGLGVPIPEFFADLIFGS